MNIAVTGGGTGGHLSIVRAIKEELNKRGIKPVFIGSSNGQDRDWFKDDEDFEAKYFLKTNSVVDKRFIGKIVSLGHIFKAGWEARTILNQHAIDIVFSVGGYSAAPATLAAILLHKKFYIHEQNAVTGRLNSLFVNKADALFCPYSENSPVRDYPVSEIFFDNARSRKSIKTIIFLGGSQGASAINDFAKRIAPSLQQNGIKIIHQCGKYDYDDLRAFYDQENIDVDLFPFHKALHVKIAEADFAISRAGASTLWELVASQVPALYIPYPYAAGDHQYYNAKFLAEQKCSFVIRQSDIDDATLSMILQADITFMSQSLKHLIKPDGAAKIVDYMGF